MTSIGFVGMSLAGVSASVHQDYSVKLLVACRDCHAVEYLDKESELELLRQTAPLVPQALSPEMGYLFGPTGEVCHGSTGEACRSVRPLLGPAKAFRCRTSVLPAPRVDAKYVC